MAIVRFTNAAKNSVFIAIADAINAGSGPAVIEIYNGTQPVTADTAITTQTLLGTLTCSDPCGSVANGQLTFGAIAQDSSADATGTATWGRLKTSIGVTVVDFNITATGAGGALQMNTTSIVAGGPILITSFVMTM